MSQGGQGARGGRLVSLRLQGFKSFGERTRVEFGSGISAVVGPNGSGKSNLADALRWALGEQGRALRLRRSEDVIFAGSERKSALGMADVQLVLDNSDGLLPVEYEQVELGRRLYRSGENDYLLNRQRVRLKDLVELLDAAHLADNAFLFIGQGMVDQALALRPEERRPLFEEVAGVRRHERRKGRAEEQLVEAEANLARVEDVLAELRPQARRLAIQAEQQASRESAGREYGRAVLGSARSRWHEAAARSAVALAALSAGRGEIERALAALREAEEATAATALELASRTEAESSRREAHEAARAGYVAAEVRGERLAADLAATARERARLNADAAAVEQDFALQQRAAMAPVLARDAALAEAVAEADRTLSEALSELAALRAERQARGEAGAALRRAEAARAAEAETIRRRLADAERQAATARHEAGAAAARAADAEARLAERATALARAVASEQAARDAVGAASAEFRRHEGVAQEATQHSAALSGQVAGASGRLDALRARLAEDEARGIAKAARRRGGRLVGEGLQVDGGFRAAVEAALGEALRGYVLGRDAIPDLASERGVVVVERAAEARAEGRTEARADGRIDVRGDGRSRAGKDHGEAQATIALAAEAGGGWLADAVRSDPTGAATRLLERVVWVPDLAGALAIHSRLPAGWIAASRDGSVVTGAGVVTLGRGESVLERRAQVERLETELERLRRSAEAAAAEKDAARAAVAEAARELDESRRAESAATAARRSAEEEERRFSREGEKAAREASWHAAQASRLEGERDRLAALAAPAPADPAPEAAAATRGAPPQVADVDVAALREWEARAMELRARRDRLAAEEARLEALRRDAESRIATAVASAAMDEARLESLNRQRAELGERERDLAAAREALAEELALARTREERARRELDDVRVAEAATRQKLARGEADVNAARERLRRAQERIRSAEVGELEARLGLEAIREQLLVELAGLGDIGVGLLEEENAGPAQGAIPAAPLAETAETAETADAGDEAAVEALVVTACDRWAAEPPVEPPAPTRLATLRRRFHELGSANPFAGEEYASIKARLEGLDAQRTDLQHAISKTRALIEQLNTMIATQFRETFRALETAFDLRFRQLFGGGFARLSLTEPDDLAATGIEIVARPPGKKAQPLSMLSGGERALTAVALLFAMLEVHPVPFCVLDEVDAALDEANVGRFAEALRGLAEQTQFIVITHNRGTIEIADALYGVTVGDDAVSRVISLRLEEARELASQVSGREG